MLNLAFTCIKMKYLGPYILSGNQTLIMVLLKEINFTDTYK